jgi:hypothetical protein
MTRRTFGLTIGAAGAGRGSSRLDRFGGWTGIQFEPTGFFRVERRERWWLVTPEGNAYLSLGLNHADPGLMLQSYNRGYWLKAFGAEGPRDERYLTGFRKRVMDDVAAFGFNSFGCHTQAARFWKPVPLPYIASLRCMDINHSNTPRDEDFLDVYAPEFDSHCEKRASEAGLAQLAKDPFLLGYAFTDCPILTELDAAPRQGVVYGAPRAGVSTWPRVLRNLPESSPGKRAYVSLMKARYGDDIGSFNEAYGVAFGSFDALARAAKWRPVASASCAAEARDNEAFLGSILDKYYGVMRAVIRRHDPHHLILGDKLNGNTDTPDFVVAGAAKHTDLVFYQWYGYYGEQKSRLDEWSRIAGKPLFNGDSAYSAPDEHMPRPLGPRAKSQAERAERTTEFARRAFGRPDFVGWSYCGWMDSWRDMPGKEMRQHAGLVDPFGNRHQPMLKALRTCSAEIYEIAMGR